MPAIPWIFILRGNPSTFSLSCNLPLCTLMIIKEYIKNVKESQGYELQLKGQVILIYQS